MIKKFDKYYNSYTNETAISAIRTNFIPLLQDDDTFEYKRVKCYDFLIARVTKKKSKLTNYSGKETLPYTVIATVQPGEDRIIYTFIAGESTTVLDLNNFSSKIKFPHSLDDELLQHITENKNMLEHVICEKFNINNMTDLDISWRTLIDMYWKCFLDDGEVIK